MQIMAILQNSVKLACLEAAFSNIAFFGILILNLQTRPVMLKYILWYSL